MILKNLQVYEDEGLFPENEQDIEARRPISDAETQELGRTQLISQYIDTGDHPRRSSLQL